jgi:quercetin dioxygenase-like cupin family protein
LKEGAPPEIHTDEHEKFLVVEGSCNFTIGTDVHALQSGDYLSIPLHVHHEAKVTSDIPCKIILQRVKA